MVSFVVLGSDVIQGGNINSNQTGGSNGQGVVTFDQGSSIFEDDDIVVFDVQNPTADGEIGSGSSISDITIFENNADYQAFLSSVAAGTPDNSLIKFNYAPQNPGQTANVQSDISGLGDSYVRFNANVLQPQNGGPTLNNTLTIAPGTNIANATGPVTLDRVSDFDLNENDTIDGSTIEVGNSNFFVGDYVDILNQVICFTAGTLIKTPEGECAIEDLCVGDMVQTANNGPQPIRWIGRKDLSPLELRLFPKFQPVRVIAGALGVGLPKRDLLVSRQHRLLVRSKIVSRMFDATQVLVPAIRLTELPGIEIENTQKKVTYIHLLLEQHEVIFAEGAPTESLYPGPEALKTQSPEGREEILTLFPELIESFLSAAALIPAHSKQRELIKRHAKNNKSVLED